MWSRGPSVSEKNFNWKIFSKHLLEEKHKDWAELKIRTWYQLESRMMFSPADDFKGMKPPKFMIADFETSSTK